MTPLGGRGEHARGRRDTAAANLRERHRIPPAAALGLAAVLGCAVLGCAVRSPLERAIAARGGPLPALARSVEARVEQGFPGLWRWRTVYRVPDRYAWTIETTRDPDHYLFDGLTVRAFVGGREVSADTSPGAALRSHARFMAVIGLDALRAAGVTVTPLAPSDLPAGVVAGLEVRFEDGTRYLLGMDGRGMITRAVGPVALPPFGAGEVTVEFDDFRPTEGWLLPYRARWQLGGVPLAVEWVLAACPDPPGLEAVDFATPAGLPACPPR